MPFAYRKLPPDLEWEPWQVEQQMDASPSQLSQQVPACSKQPQACSKQLCTPNSVASMRWWAQAAAMHVHIPMPPAALPAQKGPHTFMHAALGSCALVALWLIQ